MKLEAFTLQLLTIPDEYLRVFCESCSGFPVGSLSHYRRAITAGACEDPMAYWTAARSLARKPWDAGEGNDPAVNGAKPAIVVLPGR